MQQLCLFGDDSTVPGGGAAQRLRRPRRFAGWQLSNHACRHCFGRVLQRVVRGEVSEVRCAECGKRADGAPRMLCVCGMECGALGYALECFRNPRVTDEVPHEVLVRERRVEATQKAPARRAVRVPEMAGAH
jgi:hypothetical protein